MEPHSIPRNALHARQHGLAAWKDGKDKPTREQSADQVPQFGSDKCGVAVTAHAERAAAGSLYVVVYSVEVLVAADSDDFQILLLALVDYERTYFRPGCRSS